MVLSFKNHVFNPNQDCFKVTKRFKLILFIKNAYPLSRVLSGLEMDKNDIRVEADLQTKPRP